MASQRHARVLLIPLHINQNDDSFGMRVNSVIIIIIIVVIVVVIVIIFVAPSVVVGKK